MKLNFWYRFMLLTTAVCWAVAGGSVYRIVEAALTPNQLDGGIVINEVLANPNGSSNDFDTDQNGTAAATDEFIELYNASASAIDIGEWELWDAGTGNWFTFPASTILQPNAYALVLVGVQTGGALPTMTNPNSVAFDVGRGNGVLNNSGDNIVLYDPDADEYIQLFYDSTAADPSTYSGFSGTASIVGSAENWGNATDGISLTRSPSGDENVIVHSPTFSGNASPTAVTFAQQNTQAPAATSTALWLIAGALALTTAVLLRRRPTH